MKVKQANRLQQQEVVSRVQAGSIGLDWGGVSPFWSNAKAERRGKLWWFGGAGAVQNQSSDSAAGGLDKVGGHNRQLTLMD